MKNCKKNPNVSLHRLPHKNYFERRQKWIEALQLASDVRGAFYVCSEHFVQKDFRQGITHNFLHDSAVPRVNLPPIKPEKLKSSENTEGKVLLNSVAVNDCLPESSMCEESSADEGVFFRSVR